MVAAAGRAGASLCVLPEATYPAYVLGSAAAAREVIAAGPDPVATFADAARTAGCAVVVGLVLEGARGLENAAVLIDAQGTVRARAAKRFLWHFDRAWFVPGGTGPVHELDGRTPVGMLVCADARLPEIATDLVARGARIVANPTAWVTSMPPPEGKNSQAEFLWRVRALENRVVAVAATKVGTEADTVIYAGRSQIVAADGRVVAVASAIESELLVADVEVPTAGDRPGSVRPPPVEVRRPELRAGYLQVAVLTHDDLLDGLEEHGVDVAVGPGGVLRSGDIVLAAFADDDLLDPGAARAAALDGAELVVWHRGPGLEPVRRGGRADARAREPGVRVAVAPIRAWRTVRRRPERRRHRPGGGGAVRGAGLLPARRRGHQDHGPGSRNRRGSGTRSRSSSSCSATRRACHRERRRPPRGPRFPTGSAEPVSSRP